MQERNYTENLYLNQEEREKSKINSLEISHLKQINEARNNCLNCDKFKYRILVMRPRNRI